VQSRFGRAADHSDLILSKTSGGIDSWEDPVSIIAGYEVSCPGYCIGFSP